MITLQDLEAMSASQMVAWHNQHSEKQTKKFENRAAGLRRCIPILEALQAEAIRTEEAPESNKLSPEIQPCKGQNCDAADGVSHSDECRVEHEAQYEPVSKAAPINPEAFARLSKSRSSLGIAASWADPDVYAARTKRDGVRVTVHGETTTHKSTAAAFRAFGLPMKKHIRFRMRLKELDRAYYVHEEVTYLFTIHNEGQK